MIIALALAGICLLAYGVIVLDDHERAARRREELARRLTAEERDAA
jgi:hypothetical protein